MCSFSKLAFKEIVLPSNLKSVGGARLGAWARSLLASVPRPPLRQHGLVRRVPLFAVLAQSFFFFLFRCNIKAFISCNDPRSSTQGFMFLWEPYLDEPSRRYADKSFQWSFPCHHVHFHNLLGFCCPWFSRFEEIKCSASGGRSWWRTIGVVWVLYTPGQA